MRVSVYVSAGEGKGECEDTALVKEMMINHAQGVYEEEPPVSICLADGVGGNRGGMEAGVIGRHGIPHTIMLTSDGIHEYVSIDRLEELIRDNTGMSSHLDHKDLEIAKKVVEEAEKNGSHDDKSIIIIRT